MFEQVSLVSLWLPILLSAVIVFVAASVAWMVLPHHRGDWARLPGEDSVLGALRGAGVGPGQYMFPWAMTPEGCKEEGAKEKIEKGPIGSVVIMVKPNMARSLIQYFVYTLCVSFFVAYVGYAALPFGSEYLHVFRLLGTTAFLAYSFSLIPNAIWYGHTWSSTIKSVIDGLVFGLLTGGVFGWLWPS
jgi:hypothetical protein